MYDRVLLPTDGGDDSRAAARHAFDLAERYGATVHALYVLDTSTGWLTVSKSGVRDSLRDPGEDAADRALAAVEGVAGEYDAPLVTAVVGGSVEDAVLAYAGDQNST